MKPLLLSFLAFVPLALGARYYFVCQALQWCDRASLAVVDAPAQQLALPDGGSATLRLGTYPPGALTPPRSTQLAQGLDSLAAYLQRYPDYTLRVDAPQHPEEADLDGGYYRDLGVARAAHIASELQRRGVRGERLELSSYATAITDPVVARLALVPAGPSFAAGNLPAAESLIDSTALLGLRFETNSTALSPNDEFAAYAAQLVEALNARPELGLTLIGHTDNRAERAFNDSLGLWRAQAVARYLEQLGYDRNVTIDTQGERAPISTNDTPEGRYLNRRVEVRID